MSIDLIIFNTLKIGSYSWVIISILSRKLKVGGRSFVEEDCSEFLEVYDSVAIFIAFFHDVVHNSSGLLFSDLFLILLCLTLLITAYCCLSDKK